ncbi:6865_t:CDS:2 [Paraglomus brasilianum]|uniref:6865_t:CDS:1 n=2 Tax=Eukaryota TaxID=2759 RepID=A0A9N8W0W3_9GLOM|nr:6865_t:CDS:2 [Paraglomus brasilianum]
MSLYFRVKNRRTTIFVTSNPQDEIYSIHKVLSSIISKDPKHIRLYNGDNLLDAGQTVESAGLTDEMVLGMTTYDEETDKWEELQIDKPEPADYEVSSYDEDNYGKGKARA